MNSFIKCLQNDEERHNACFVHRAEPLKELGGSMKQVEYNVREFATTPGELTCHVWGTLRNEVDQQMIWTCMYTKDTT